MFSVNFRRNWDNDIVSPTASVDNVIDDYATPVDLLCADKISNWRNRSCKQLSPDYQFVLQQCKIYNIIQVIDGSKSACMINNRRKRLYLCKSNLPSQNYHSKMLHESRLILHQIKSCNKNTSDSCNNIGGPAIFLEYNMIYTSLSVQWTLVRLS